MKFCEEHWAMLRAEVEKKGLSALVPDNGETAAAQLADQLVSEHDTPANFDPLMGAHWAIVANVSEMLQVPMIVLPGCPLCEANDAHRRSCTEAGCESTFDDWAGKAVDDQLARARELGLVDEDGEHPGP